MIVPKDSAAARMCHPECIEGFTADMNRDLVYGPYAIPLDGTDMPCRICDGTGSHTTYSSGIHNPPALWGQPAPCEFCHGTGMRKKLNFVSMEEWARLTGNCVYCGEPRRR